MVAKETIITFKCEKSLKLSEQTFSRATALRSTKNGGGSAAFDRKSAIEVLGDARSFV